MRLVAVHLLDLGLEAVGREVLREVHLVQALIDVLRERCACEEGSTWRSQVSVPSLG